MSDFPAMPAGFATQLPPPIPAWAGVSAHPGNLTRGPLTPYKPESFSTLYLWWAIIAGLHLLLLVPSLILWPLHFIALPIFIASVVFEVLILYKAWNQIQDGAQRTTPGRAVGFGFIPFFNFYWWFTEYQGLAEDANSFTRKYGLNTPLVSVPLAATICILSICKWLLCWLPVLNSLLVISEIVLLVIFLHQVKLASMAIAQAKITAAAQAGTLPGMVGTSTGG